MTCGTNLKSIAIQNFNPSGILFQTNVITTIVKMQLLTLSTYFLLLSTSSLMAFQVVPLQPRTSILQQSNTHQHPLSSRTVVFAKGFASSSSSSSKHKKKNQHSYASPTTLNKKTFLQKVQKTYGTSSSSSPSQQQQQIAKATQQIIEAQIQALPDPWKQAIQLYQQVRMHKAKLSQLSVYQQSQLPESVLASARHVESQLDQLLQTHQNLMIQPSDIHTLLQKITWDASADAKTARGLTGTMPTDIQKRIDQACTWIAETIVVGHDAELRMCLDVGCGFGTLVPQLRRVGIRDSQIHGVDLSDNMIDNARALYPDCQFLATDFWKFQPTIQNNNNNNPETSSSKTLSYHGILFCSSLHDFPDPQRTIQHAISLLHRPGGRLVIVHAQGAGHVQNQVMANPVLVPRALPTAEELVAWTTATEEKDGSWPKGRWIYSPAAPNTPRDREEGYLAVFETTE
jgi:SAM-dependent methyltransferase